MPLFRETASNPSYFSSASAIEWWSGILNLLVVPSYRYGLGRLCIRTSELQLQEMGFEIGTGTSESMNNF